MSISAGEGERIAASGYYPQYLVSAKLTIDVLKQNDLEWVKIADPDAGQVDDLQLARTARLDAYQIKWKQYRGTISFNDLVKSKKGSKPLFKQLADSWIKLKEAHPNRRIVVHLLTSAIPSSSSSAKLPEFSNPPTPYHFSAFIEQAWNSSNFDTKKFEDNDWKPVWDRLKVISGLSGDKFIQFVNDCSLDFNFSEPPKNEDHKKLANLIFEIAGDSEKKIKIDRKELLKRLNWEDKYEYRSKHEFEVPKFYRPIKGTVDKLIDQIENFSGGYVALTGGPGSGKSTLLTRTLRKLPHRLIRYYAYVPDAQDPTVIRGESDNFLHDVTLRLKNAGFGQNLHRHKEKDRISLLQLFHKQLQELGEDYSETDRKTIILIDGLDHISREQEPQRSLLKDLPKPAQVPDGVYLVIGSQTIDLSDIPVHVCKNIDNEERFIEIDRLEPFDVREIVSNFVPSLKHEQHKKIYNLSSGHPLVLIYLTKKLITASTDEEIEELLSDATPYKEDINNYYWSHWEKIKDDDPLTYTLGLLSRVRGAINIEWVQEWVKNSVARKINSLFGQYFNVDAANRWYFFHNSFRLFLQEQTSKPLLGGSNSEREIQFHKDLADRYLQTNLQVKHEALYHLYNSGNFNEIIEVASNDWFKKQISELRPLDAIQGDVHLAIKAASNVRDSLSLIRLTLLSSAIEQRDFIVNDKLISEKLLEIGEISIAIEHIRDGDSLRIERIDALNLSCKLYELDLITESNRLFELSEPYELLSGYENPENTQYQDPDELLISWAKAAPIFREPVEILKSIEKVVTDPRYNTEESDEINAQFRQYLRIKAAESCAEKNWWDDWETFVKSIKENKPAGLLTTYLNSIYSLGDNQKDKALSILNSLIDKYEPISIEGDELRRIENRIDVAELLYFDKEDPSLAEEWIEDIEGIPITKDSLLSGNNVDIYDLRFRFYRMRYLLGDERTPSKIIEEDSKFTNWNKHTSEEERNAFESLSLIFTSLAYQYKQGYFDSPLTPSYFLRENEWIINFIDTLFDVPMNLRFRLSSGRENVVRLLVLTAYKQGPEVVNKLFDYLQDLWKEDYWTFSNRRLAIITLTELGMNELANKLMGQISRVDNNFNNPRDRADDHWERANTWLQLNNKEKAKQELVNMVKGARGLLDDHDHQSIVWVRWMGKINKLDPKNSANRIFKMFRRIASVSDYASGTTEAGKKLLAEAYKWNPEKGLLLFFEILQKRILRYDSATKVFLEAALEDEKPPLDLILQGISRLLIPLCSENISELIKLFIDRVEKEYDKKEIIKASQFLADRINAEALSSNRKGYLNTISQALKEQDIDPNRIGIQESKISAKTSDSSDDKVLKAKNGRDIPIEEAIKIVDSPEGLKKLIELNDPERDGYFDWRKMGDEAIKHANNKDDIKLISKLIDENFNQRNHSLLFSNLSQKARKLNENQLAEELAFEAVEKSDPVGWDKWMDGGSRLKALRALKKINPDEALLKSIKLFGSDIGNSRVSTRRLVHHFDDIVELLFLDVPVEEIWRIIQDYLEDLYCSVEIKNYPEFEDKFFNENNGRARERKAATALSQYLISNLAHPSYIVASQSLRACATILNSDQNYEELNEALKFILNESDSTTEKALVILDAVSVSNPQCLKPFIESINELNESPNLLIRVKASILEARYKNEPTRVKRLDSDLPSVYTLELPEFSKYQTDFEPREENKSELVGDPAKLLRPLDIEVREIAEITGLDVDVVIYRTSKYYEQFSQENSTKFFNHHQLNEEQVLNFLRYVGPKVSFHKPHIEPVRRAILYILAELWDAGLLTPNETKRLLTNFENKEKHQLLKEPVRRPTWINSTMGLPEDEHIYTMPKDWVEDCEESLSLLKLKPTIDRIILGEFTKLSYQGVREGMEEDRISLIAGLRREEFWNSDTITKGSLPFLNYFRLPIENYLNTKPSEKQWIICQSAYDLETPGKNWIAFNPKIAMDLGWHYSDRGNFRWIDKNGNVAVESIWWTDGNINRHEESEYCSSGEGWIVLASYEAYKMISEKSKHINRGGLVRRRAGFAGNKGTAHKHKFLNLNQL